MRDFARFRRLGGALLLLLLLVIGGVVLWPSSGPAPAPDRPSPAPDRRGVGDVGDGTGSPPRASVAPLSRRPSAAPRERTSPAGVATREERRLELQVRFSRLEREGRLREYAADLEASLTGRAEDREALRELVILLGAPELRDPGKQHACLSRLVEYDRSDPDELFALARFEARAKSVDRASRLVTEAAERAPPVRSCTYLLNGARMLIVAGAPTESSRLCERILSAPAARPVHLLHAAELLERLECPEAAERAYRLVEASGDIHLKDYAALGLCRIQGAARQPVRATLEALAAGSSSPDVRQDAAALLRARRQEPSPSEDAK